MIILPPWLPAEVVDVIMQKMVEHEGFRVSMLRSFKRSTLTTAVLDRFTNIEDALLFITQLSSLQHLSLAGTKSSDPRVDLTDLACTWAHNKQVSIDVAGLSGLICLSLGNCSYVRDVNFLTGVCVCELCDYPIHVLILTRVNILEDLGLARM